VKRAEAYALRWSDHAPVSVEYGLDDGRFGSAAGLRRLAVMARTSTAGRISRAGESTSHATRMNC
jgi:hypothetical protein